MTWERAERRKFPRIDRPCKIHLRKKEAAEVFSTRTENISCGGVCVVLPKDLGIYTPVEVELDLEDKNNPIKCLATIVWSLQRRNPKEEKQGFFDTGLEFSNLTEDDRIRIDKIVQEWSMQEES